jgi:nitrogen fixation protein FixH
VKKTATYILFVVLSGLMLLSLAACDNVYDSKPAGVVGDLQLSLSTEPDPAIKQQPTTVRVEVKDKAGVPVEGATVTLKSGMPGMSHGGPKGTLADKGKGIYEATGTFSMGGTWRLGIEVTTTGTSKTTGEFDIQIK